MMTHFSSEPFLAIKKIGDMIGDGASSIRPRSSCSFTHRSSTVASFCDQAYGLHLRDFGASGASVMLMSGFCGGGSCLLNSSEKTFQYLQNSSGIPFSEGRVLLFCSHFSQS
jgi:hypothetical protein